MAGGFAGIGSMQNVTTEIETEYHGCTMVFGQATAPVGWTQVTTNNDLALRVVSGSTGGTFTTTNQGFSTVNTNAYTMFGPETVSTPFSMSATTITTSTMESHSHTMSAPGTPYGWINSGTAESDPIANEALSYPQTSGSAGSGGGHGHTGTVTGYNYPDTFSLGVQYMDVILATYNY
jgi:hypothetical protein